jgi:ATP-dependent Clp protease ATP-binding subunit ClpA
MPLSDEMLASIVKLQLSRIKKRIEANHKVAFDYDDEAIKLIIARCTEVESGGRMIDAILTNTVLPTMSQEISRARWTAARSRASRCRRAMETSLMNTRTDALHGADPARRGM